MMTRIARLINSCLQMFTNRMFYGDNLALRMPNS